MDIYVGNLSFESNEKEIKELFAPFGTVARVKLVEDPHTGQPRGFAFVTMDDLKEAQKAIAELDGKDFDGRPLKINAAREREQRPGGGNRGGNSRRW